MSMTTPKKWTAFVTKLNRLTQDDQIEWESTSSQSDLRDSDYQQYGPAYVADVLGGVARIYIERTREMTANEEEYWNNQVVLEVRTRPGTAFTRIPTNAGLADLYEIVTLKVSGMSDFLDQFLTND